MKHMPTHTLCALMRHRRNKQLAHYDLQTLLTAKTTPLPGPSRQEIEEGLAMLRNFMNTLQQPFTNASTAYQEICLTTDGNLLAEVLRGGLRYHELVRTGVIPWNDLDSPMQTKVAPE